MAPSDTAAVQLPAGLSARALTAADVPQALRLSEEARWNQVAADWRIFVELGKAVAVTTEEGRLVATAAMLPYGGRFGWISMVLVTAHRQRQGIATWLLRQCVEALRRESLVPVLDATPAGRAVYLGLGFEDGWGMRRLVTRDARSARAAPPVDGLVVRPLIDAEWPELIAYDAAIFGAGRGALLRRLAARLPRAALVAERGGRRVGHVLGRDGRVMTQLGPVAAEDDAIAKALFAAALARLLGPVAIDIPDRHAALGEWLAGRGFTAERPLIRMVYRQSAGFDDGARLFAIAGPELG